jgi:predicted peptidase
MVSALWAVDGKIRYTEVPDCGHGSWLHAYAYEEALKWLFSQKRKN